MIWYGKRVDDFCVEGVDTPFYLFVIGVSERWMKANRLTLVVELPFREFQTSRAHWMSW